MTYRRLGQLLVLIMNIRWLRYEVQVVWHWIFHEYTDTVSWVKFNSVNTISQLNQFASVSSNFITIFGKCIYKLISDLLFNEKHVDG